MGDEASLKAGNSIDMSEDPTIKTDKNEDPLKWDSSEQSQSNMTKESFSHRELPTLVKHMNNKSYKRPRPITNDEETRLKSNSKLKQAPSPELASMSMMMGSGASPKSRYVLNSSVHKSSPSLKLKPISGTVRRN